MRFVFSLALLGLISFSAQAGSYMTCHLRYQMEGWSFFYKDYRGTGIVDCENGQSAQVRVLSRGGGLTIGKSEIDDGTGVVTTVRDISEVYGDYVYLDTHAGLTRSAEVVVMTKGEVSLALTGLGRGVDVGASIGVFSILPQ
jgi:hypothetical protein